MSTPTHRRWWERRTQSVKEPNFLDLAKENQAVMMRLAIRLWDGNRDAAEETVQEAIVSAYKFCSEGRFTDFGNFRPWILRIVVNAFHQEKRKQKRFVALDGEHEDLENMLSVQEDPLKEDIDPRLLTAIRGLSADQRSCLLLVDLDGLEYQEAATILGVPVGTVRSRLARARFKVAEMLTDSGYVEEHHV